MSTDSKKATQCLSPKDLDQVAGGTSTNLPEILDASTSYECDPSLNIFCDKSNGGKTLDTTKDWY